MRASPVALALAVVLGSSAARGGAPDAEATRELFDRLVERERAPLLVGATRSLSSFAVVPSAPAIPALDCVHATYDVTLDPSTGKTDATMALRVRATAKPLASISFAIDGGLEPGKITAGGHVVTANDGTFAGTRVVRVDLDPPIAPGDEAVVKVPYAGTLGCAPSERSATVCSKSGDFAFFTQESIFPYVFATEAADDVLWDGFTRDIVLRVPPEDDVVATGQKVSEAIEGANKVSRWSIDHPLARNVGVYALVGKLGEASVAGRTIPTTYYHPSPRVAFDDELVAWSAPALDFIERATGAKLPFATNLSLVRLPRELGDPGTATFGMTLLSDSYAKTGDLMYEETWAHENAHLFWGVVVPETDSNESRLMTEGMATLMQVEYSHDRHFAAEDRDEYLARRFVPMSIDLRTTGKDLPPVVVRKGTEPMALSRTRRYTMWAYYRPAITLDHLRVTVGEDVFANALASYRARCAYVGCRPDDLRAAVEAASGKDLGAFFDRWMTEKERPNVRIGFTPTAGGADVELTKDDDRPMTLELRVTLEGGTRVHRRVDLGPRVTRVHVDGDVLAVAANPRHDTLVDVRSAVAGDLDFDGEVDGFDVLRCARQVGRTYDPKPAGGLWDPRASFDARCDVNDDLTIDDRDLAELARSFGTLRER